MDHTLLVNYFDWYLSRRIKRSSQVSCCSAVGETNLWKLSSWFFLLTCNQVAHTG